MARSNSPTNPSLDATLDVLSHSTRRYLLWYLGRESERISVERLAAAVAAWQIGDGLTDVERAELDPDAHRRAHVSLRHVHLPRLESAGLIERVRESGTGNSEAEESESDESGAEYVEETVDGTSVDAFLDAVLRAEFEECDQP